jgi:hypothetical protein
VEHEAVQAAAATDDGQPLLLTVEEAARMLRIGRTLAYELTRRYRTSGGTEGLLAIQVGSCLRVPLWALVELACNGRVVDLSLVALDDTGLRWPSTTLSDASRQRRRAVRGRRRAAGAAAGRV